MSIFKKLNKTSQPEKLDKESEIDEEETESYSEISDLKKEDIKRFINSIKQKAVLNEKIEKLMDTQYNYYCPCCDKPFKSLKEVTEHENTEDHIEKEKEYKKTQYNFKSYDKRIKDNMRM